MFEDRVTAGAKLALRLKEELPSWRKEEAVVLSIPRGGVVVGGEISRILGLPHYCLITKKIPSPDSEELAIGAVAEGGIVVWDEELCQRLGVSPQYRQEIVKKKVLELAKKQEDFKKGAPALQLEGKVVILVDDGVATGATIKAAIEVVASFNPGQIIVAVPVIAKDSLEEIKTKVDKVIFLEAPEMFFSVGQFYKNFDQLSDEKVREILGH
ncbi:MAG: phosphoribosyltransferase [Microgenomates group bacterium]